MGPKTDTLLLIVTAIHCFILPVQARQVVEGTIMNAETGEPLPYVNIGIPLQETGTVSDVSGFYSLSYSAEIDSVLFSAIGFESVTHSIFYLFQNPTVRMIPALYEMDDIVVTGMASESSDIYGHRLRRRGYNIGFGSTQLGTEIGAIIEIRRPVLIQSRTFK